MRVKAPHLLLMFALGGVGALQAQPQYTIERLNDRISSPAYDEIGPIISQDGKTLFFTRVKSPDFVRTLYYQNEDLSQTYVPSAYDYELGTIYAALEGKGNTRIVDPIESNFNQDIWIATYQNGEFSNIQHPGYPLNNALPNSVCSLTPDPKTVVLINQFPRVGGMEKGFSLSTWQDSVWTYPSAIAIENYYSYRSGLTMTMSNDGAYIILAIDRDNSRGGSDLFLCRRMMEGYYSAPINLGVELNTTYNETTPHLSADSKMLYFSSNRPDGLGGMDIYFSERLDDTWEHWSAARRFVEPINSRDDDSYPYFNPATGQLYFASRRGYSSDIYRVQIAPPMEAIDTNLLIAVKPETPELQPTTAEDLIMEFVVQHSKTSEMLDANIKIKSKGMPDQEVNTTSGRAMIPITPGVHYEITAEREGFIHRPKAVYFERDISLEHSKEQILLLDPIEIGANIKLNPIFFERSQPTILPKSYPELEYLADLLQTHSGMAIRIEGHTDTNGRPSELQDLSEKRARAVRDFLITRGISPNRIEAVGFGGARPIATNESEENRSRNRRVEVKITRTNL